jgi:hypothetical protein
MKQYSLEEIKSIVRPKLGADVPLALFRILRIIAMNSLLGESSAQTLYVMGKSVGNMLGAETIDDFKRILVELKIGIPEVELIEEDRINVKLYECITCAGFPTTGEMFCDMESGIIAGLLEKVYHKRAKSTQTRSWTIGYTYCQFEVFLF